MPRTSRVGTIGPDSGFAFRLARSVFDQLHLGSVDRDDAASGAVGVGMKRAALFARGPVIHDVTVGFTVFGFFDESPDPELVAWREKAFAQISSPHHYFERQAVIDRVPDEVLLAPHSTIIATYQSDWRRNLTR